MRLLLVEDHVALSHWLTMALRNMHWTVECAMNGTDADTLLHTQQYALVILDLTLPKMDGLNVLKRLRTRGSITPVLILSARDNLQDKIQSLNSGADDYLSKPFELAELAARIQALLRRTQGNQAVICRCEKLHFDTVSRIFTYDDTILTLTPREHAVLEALITRAGQVVSKKKLFDQVFSLTDDANPSAIEIYIHRLRKKLASIGANQIVITTLRGLGYLLKADA